MTTLERYTALITEAWELHNRSIFDWEGNWKGLRRPMKSWWWNHAAAQDRLLWNHYQSLVENNTRQTIR